jgi:hypothetical protein
MEFWDDVIGAEVKTTKVINIRDAPEGWKWSVDYTYIGRGGRGLAGKWGNPFRLYKEEDRDYKLKEYRYWLHHQPTEYLAEMVHDLDGQILVCFCKPKACHGDIIVEFIEDFWNGNVQHLFF